MQIAVDTNAVSQFNNNAPTLESVTIKGRTFEVFRDYYHNRPVPYRNGIQTYKSVMFREATDRTNWQSGYAPLFFNRKSKAQTELQTWFDAMLAKYSTDEEAGGKVQWSGKVQALASLLNETEKEKQSKVWVVFISDETASEGASVFYSWLVKAQSKSDAIAKVIAKVPTTDASELDAIEQEIIE